MSFLKALLKLFNMGL